MNEGNPANDDLPSGDEPAPQIRARVPDHVSDGVFSNAVIVMTGPSEFVIDFLQTISRPQRVAARVVLPHPVMPQFIEALKKNIDIYSNRFGPPSAPQMPKPAEGSESRRPTPQDIYDDLKMPDSLLSGSYANAVMIGHASTEFSLDLMTSFFPQSAVSSRVYVSAGQIPRLLESLQTAWTGLQHRGKPAPPPNLPAPNSTPPTGNIPDATDAVNDANPPGENPGGEIPDDDSNSSGANDK